MMPTKTFFQVAAMALIGGGALTLLINVALTPALPHNVSFATTAASIIFLWRQSASALAAALLLIGCVGLYLRQAERAGYFGVFAFTLALVGTALALGVEWREVFDVHDFARRAPDALNALDAEKGLTLSNIGAIIAISTFMVGWILLAVATLRTRAANRIAAWMVIAGFLSTPLLRPVLPGLWGAAVGNAILGSGLAWLGYDIFSSNIGERELDASPNIR
jgi:hypothetical protein